MAHDEKKPQAPTDESAPNRAVPPEAAPRPKRKLSLDIDNIETVLERKISPALILG